MRLERRYLFGAEAGAREPADVAVRDEKDLSASFLPFQTWTGQFSINSEMERYQPFNPQNHVISADALTLVGRLDRSRWKRPFDAAVGAIGWFGFASGQPVSLSRFGLPEATAVEEGQIAIVQGRGAFVVAGLGPDATATFRPLGTALETRAHGGLIAFLPAYALALAKPARNAVGGTQLEFANLPEGLVPGAMVGWAEGANAMLRDRDYRVAAIDRAARLVTVTPPMRPRAQGNVIVFTPPITSGQIWSRQALALGKRTYALDFRVVLPGDSAGGYDAAGISDLGGFAGVPSDYPWGAWPALWLYGKNAGATPFRGDEIDVFEGYWDTYRGPHAFSGVNHGGSPNQTTFYREDGGWRAIDGTYRRFERPLSGERRFTVVVTPERTLRYVDGVLVKSDSFGWKNPRPAEIGVNLAVGALDASAPMNLLAPLAERGFANMRFGIRSIAVYAAD